MTAKAHMPPRRDLEGYEVLVCVCGGIAAYKLAHVVSDMVQRGAGVTVAMSRAARKFVGPVTFQALTGRPVLTSLWASQCRGDIQHIGQTDAADLVLVAPATANILGKIACGIADDVVSTLVISAASPVLLAPAMNDRMWANPIVQDNVAALRQKGYEFIGPEEGWLACGHVGPGRMSEAVQLIEAVGRGLAAKPPKASSGDH